MPDALLQAYLEKRAMLVRYFTARARDAATAEDVVQEIYLKIAALGPHYSVENPTAFLFTTGSHIWLNRIRGQGRQRSRDGQWLSANHMDLAGEMIADIPSAENEVMAREQLALITAALQELPEKTQEIFRLGKFEGMTQAQVAAHLHISKSSVEKHQYTALRHLSDRLKGAGGP
ncbi:RNA polymerase sigma factor [Asticcacaulis sp. AC466]|uniref:RNA polymerase sigma factor n=1 Tax=Asticcacaulis sp. AC466 TaxID=1282362 RepID=UPI0003F9C046|nr:sigma-70 family RNA polymerase sigma factor [Asticcacaulis sp. AC466]